MRVHKTCIRMPSMADRIIEGWPVSTGELVRRLGIQEARLADAVRRGHIEPPLVRAGRRQWWPVHVRSAIDYFGITSVDVHNWLQEAGLEGR